MADHFSLAQHLHQAATEHPDNSALINNGNIWSFANLQTDIRSLAKQISPSLLPLIEAGNSLHLARHAYACSVQNRPFWPVDRSKPLPECIQALPDVALIISTSGSEGQPRSVLLGKTQLDAAAAASNKHLPLGPGDLWLNCLPLYHIGGQAVLWRCARAAAGVLLHEGFNAKAVADDLQHYPVTHISLVPAMLAQLLELQTKPPTSLRVTLIGGAALSQQLYDKAIAAGWPLYPSYGMSETAAQLASFDPSQDHWHEGLVGKPMPGHEIRIGNDGRIAVRGPQVMLGYLNGGGVDAEGWLTTGDLGSIDVNGCLTVIGRADDMLISGGSNVHPLEVESCLAACPGVSDVAVTGLPDPVWGDLIVALIVGTAEQSTLLAHARKHLPSAALPRKTIFLERLPRNAAGKIERATLRRLAAEADA
ncbi:MAG TPA: AMP-binding protein [Azonexus sp.]|nr:AMP-binding protein [Azonexus sp.]